MAVEHRPRLLNHACWLWKQRSRLLKTNTWGNFSASSTWSTRPATGYRARSVSFWVHRNFWQLSRDRKLHGLHVTRHNNFSKTVLQSTLEGGRTVVSSGNAGWTTSKSGHPCLCQNYSQGPPAEKTGRGSLLNHLSCPPIRWPNQSRDWTELTLSISCFRRPSVVAFFRMLFKQDIL